MLTETVSGKCPCCEYDKLLQRYGSSGYFQMDGCPNCGFGYGSNGQDENEETIGFKIWKHFGVYSIAHTILPNYINLFEDDAEITRSVDSIIYNGGRTKEDKAYDKAVSDLNLLEDIELRKLIFDWTESQGRYNDIENTIFQYSEGDVEKYLESNPTVFRPGGFQLKKRNIKERLK